MPHLPRVSATPAPPHRASSAAAVGRAVALRVRAARSSETSASLCPPTDGSGPSACSHRLLSRNGRGRAPPSRSERLVGQLLRRLKAETAQPLLARRAEEAAPAAEGPQEGDGGSLAARAEAAEEGNAARAMRRPSSSAYSSTPTAHTSAGVKTGSPALRSYISGGRYCGVEVRWIRSSASDSSGGLVTPST